ncbi:peroxidase family protein [Peristeroidobacter soli]|uniref:peroxidase family protein n=1 Tax=Peristeroidobacter soli TaxID=2497877 RepID=UPI00101C8D13|nr:peroxidase family protein [Peristeroidobacter soli]
MLTEQQLTTLAQVMTESSHVSRFIDVGYTYLGQFIAHDIVPQTNPIPGQSRDVLPYLNMDSVYGSGAQTATLLDAHGLFPIKRQTPQGPEDLPRTNGVPNIPELRNDDNVIVSQLHLFWQRFHNTILRRGYANDVGQARAMSTLTFQLVVVEDYLRQVLAPAVFDSVFRFDRRWLNLPSRPIAREFAHAAFRFGHSMVRPFYESFPNQPDVTLPELFQTNRNLDPRLELDFRRMFGWPVLNNRVEDAMTIDPFITREMRQVPIPTGVTINIAEMNLRAGAQLPPGKAYVQQLLAGPNGAKLAAAFGVQPLPDLGPLTGRLPATSGITIDNLPLWPYLLVEAVHASEGKHLGVVGSLICAEGLANAIAGASHSIYCGRWCPVDEVLSSLGKLGEELQEQRRAFANAAYTDRTFCLRHVIELVLRNN